MSLVTILTPTYNREDKLIQLYRSLKCQINKDFTWMIIDDGSNDGTEKLVKSIISDSSLDIIYEKKENGGKHTAVNRGVKQIESVLTMIVDSDDILTPDAVEQIHNYYLKYKNYPQKIGAFSFLKCNQSNKALVSLPKEEFVDSYIKVRIKQHRPGDMAEVFYTSVFREYPFPEYPGEKFLSEDVVWISIGKENLFVFINKPIYICEYLEGGLTSNDKAQKFMSPLGSMERGNMLMEKECGLISNIRGAIIYNCYKINVCNDIPERLINKDYRKKALLLLTRPLGTFFFYFWRRK